MDNLTQPERKPYRGKAIRAVTNSPFFLEDRDQPQQSTTDKQPVAAGKVIQFGGFKIKTIDKCLPLNAIDEEFDSDEQYSSTDYEDTSEDDDLFDDDPEEIEKEESADSEKKEMATENDTSSSDVEGDEPLKEEAIDKEKIQEITISTSIGEFRLDELLGVEVPINEEEKQGGNEMKTDETLVQGEDNQTSDDNDTKENEPVPDNEKPSTSQQRKKRPAQSPEPQRFLTIKVPRFDRLLMYGDDDVSPFTSSDVFYPGTPAVLQNCFETNERLKLIHRNGRGIKSMLHGRVRAYDKNWNLSLADVVQVWHRRDKNQLNGRHLPEPIGKRYYCGVSGVIESYQGNGMWQCERQLNNIEIQGKQVVMANTTKR